MTIVDFTKSALALTVNCLTPGPGGGTVHLTGHASYTEGARTERATFGWQISRENAQQMVDTLAAFGIRAGSTRTAPERNNLDLPPRDSLKP